MKLLFVRLVAAASLLASLAAPSSAAKTPNKGLPSAKGKAADGDLVIPNGASATSPTSSPTISITPVDVPLEVPPKPPRQEPAGVLLLGIRAGAFIGAAGAYGVGPQVTGELGFMRRLGRVWLGASLEPTFTWADGWMAGGNAVVTIGGRLGPGMLRGALGPTLLGMRAVERVGQQERAYLGLQLGGTVGLGYELYFGADALTFSVRYQVLPIRPEPLLLSHGTTVAAGYLRRF